MADEPKSTVGRESDKFMLRFPDGMRERIAELAKQNGRSMNAEIIARLESSVSGGADNASLLATIARLNLDLALGEMDKQGLEAEVANLAFYLQQASELLLRPLENSDDFRLGLVKIFAEQAKPHLGKLETLGTDMQARLTNIQRAVQELSHARANLVAISEASQVSNSIAPTNVPPEPPQRHSTAGGMDLDDIDLPEPPQPTEPPKRPPRIRRPAPKLKDKT